MEVVSEPYTHQPPLSQYPRWDQEGPKGQLPVFVPMPFVVNPGARTQQNLEGCSALLQWEGTGWREEGALNGP